MNALLANAKNTINVWKMAWLKAGLVAVITGFTTLQTSLNGITWEAFNGTQKVLLVGGVIVAMASSLVGFLDRTISRIDAEQKELASQGSIDKTGQTPTITP